jgi:hypothetical protein
VIGATTSSPSAFWFLTRGSGVVTLVLLTAAICLGVTATLGWQRPRLPRFVVAGLHRNITLLAVVFLAVHVLTTVADRYTSIGFENALIPFTASYRPLWLGLGALASDLVLALVLTSLLRVRLGYRTWRLTHWFAYASWPLALVHGLGTGSDARFGWMVALAAACITAVAAAVTLRALHDGLRPRPLALLAAAAALTLALGYWYEGGPARKGWAARSGTPPSLLLTAGVRSAATPVAPSLPTHFSSHLSGSLRQSSPDQAGFVTVMIDATLRGKVGGEVRVALKGAPTAGGGVAMSASGVAFEGASAPVVYEGRIVALEGTEIVAVLEAPGHGALRLTLRLEIDQRTGHVRGSVHGVVS